MADIAFACANCQQELEAPEEMAGQAVECPGCQQQLIIPLPDQAETVDSDDASESSNVPPQVNCSNCGEEMPSEAVLCVNCGYHTKLGTIISTKFQ